jgi:hypothetical protein
MPPDLPLPVIVTRLPLSSVPRLSGFSIRTILHYIRVVKKCQIVSPAATQSARRVRLSPDARRIVVFENGHGKQAVGVIFRKGYLLTNGNV